MLHIILLNKGYFPEKLTKFDSNDKVVVLASLTDAIPVVAYQNEGFRNMEVKLIPELKDTNSQEGKAALRIAQAMLIGQITAGVKDYSIYSDDDTLVKALAPFTGVKKTTAKKASSSKPSKAKAEAVLDVPAKTEEVVKVEEPKKPAKKAAEKKTEKKIAKIEVQAPVKEKAEEKVTEITKAKKPRVTKADVQTKPAKLPTLAEVKRVLGAANSGYSKVIMNVIKKSNQITFEMDLRMKLAEAGAAPNVCKELAASINEEFGKSLPTTM